MKTRRVSQLGSRAFVYFVLLVMSAAYFFPLYWMLISALKEPQEVAQWPPTFFPQTFTFNAFAEVLKTFPVFRWFVNSAFVSSSIVLIVLLATSLAAFAFAYYDFPAKNFLFMYILSTLMIPIHVRMIPSYLLIKMFRWIETYRGLIIPQAAALCGIGVLLLRQFYVGIPRDLVDAARIDGCREVQIYLHVGLPLIRPALVALGVYVMLTSWNDFVWPLLVVQRENMRTLPLGLVSTMDLHMPGSGVSWPQRMAAATLVASPMLILYMFFRNLFVKGITFTGIKG